VFGRATIRLGIGPHSSCILIAMVAFCQLRFKEMMMMITVQSTSKSMVRHSRKGLS